MNSDLLPRHNKTIASFFLLLGIVTTAADSIGFVRFGSLSPYRESVALLYGIASTVTGVALWLRSHFARYAYLAWCSTIPLFVLTYPEARDPYLLPSYVGLIAILAWVYSRVFRHSRGSSEPLGSSSTPKTIGSEAR
jgi:hypothetical protein